MGEGLPSQPSGALQSIGVAEVDREDAPREVAELIEWVIDQGFAEPEIDVSVEDPVTGEEICVAEALWREGLQAGLGEPVVLELELTDESDAKVAALGYRAFPSALSLREFVERLERERLGELVGKGVA